MKKLLILLAVLIFSAQTIFAAKIPEDIQTILKSSFPNVDVRFDGVIILPDGTLYLPLYPAKIKTPETTSIESTIPGDIPLNKKPDVVIFNNDFVLLKVLVNSDGSKTVKKFDKPPIVVKTGLLPQDMLVPKNFIIPENLKGILGALNIKVEPKEEIKVLPAQIEFDKQVTPTKKRIQNNKLIQQLKDKILYITTTYSKDIQVVKGESRTPEYALSLQTIPRTVCITPDSKFLLVTTYNSTIIEVISIADDRIIKQIDITSNADEIVIDKKNNLAYISSPTASTIYQLSLSDMTLKKKIKVNGYCEKLALYEDYLFYVDKMSNKIWSVEFEKEYTLKDLGSYPSISKLLYADGYLFFTSRTKNRIAVLDYKNETLFTEFQTVEKPTDMIIYDKYLYVLGAEDNAIQVIDTKTCEPISKINLNSNGFATTIQNIPNSNLAIVSDTKTDKYYIIDLVKKCVIKTNTIDLPVKQIVLGNNVRKL